VVILITKSKLTVEAVETQELASSVDTSYFELSSFHDMVTKANGGVNMTDVDIKDLYLWLRNPIKHRKQLIQLSKYYYVKDGIVTDVYDLFKTLPILNYSVLWENMEHKSFSRSKKNVDKFIKDIKLKKLARDTIFTVVQEGGCVWYNRGNKYIQFLTFDQVEIPYMINGKWQVLFNMSYFDQFRVETGLEQQIEAAPDEVTMATYLAFKKDRTKQYVVLDINKTQVFKFRGSRNEPYSFPYCIPALASIIHRDLLEKTEKALADRIINQIILQKVGTMPSQDGKTQLPVPKPTVEGFHNNLKGLLQKKYDGASTENTSTAPLTVPSFVTIEELKVNMNTFPKDVWERIDRDIYKKLGYSMSLNMGGGSGQSFGSSTINVEKIFSIIFYLLEDIEEAIDEYTEQIANVNVSSSIKFSRTTILDKDTAFKQAESLYLKGRGSLKDFVEASNRDFDHWLSQVRYENEVLKLDEILPVHSTSFTQSDNGTNNGRPTDPSSGNENTDASKGNGGNNTPSPSS
jgi:hypothetical protein